MCMYYWSGLFKNLVTIPISYKKYHIPTATFGDSSHAVYSTGITAIEAQEAISMNIQCYKFHSTY